MTQDNTLSGRRILVVEDEVIVAWLLEESLFSIGCKVIGPATSVDKALEIIARGGIDAVSLDINLNGEKSYPVADSLIARGVPFYFSTGYNRDSIPISYKDIPMLQKPYDTTKLSAMLRILLTPKDSNLRSSEKGAVRETDFETQSTAAFFDRSYFPQIRKRIKSGH